MAQQIVTLPELFTLTKKQRHLAAWILRSADARVAAIPNPDREEILAAHHQDQAEGEREYQRQLGEYTKRMEEATKQTQPHRDLAAQIEKNYLEMAALLGDGAPDWDQVAEAVKREQSVPTVEKELDRLHFTERVMQLKEAGRLDDRTLQNFEDMAAESADMNEFKSRMHYGGPRMLGATEYRYLQSVLDTPEGGTPYSWEESEAYVKAFGFDQYETVCRISQMERDRQQMAAPSYAQ